MNNKYLLSPGHGGMLWGHYLTPGKRSPCKPWEMYYPFSNVKSKGIYEGEFNRDIAARVAADDDDIEVLVPGPIRVPLMKRVAYVNQLHKEEKNLILISIHANAFGDGGWNDIHGHRIFVAPTASKRSKQLAGFIDSEFRNNVYEMHRRTIKEYPYTIIARTTCPAVLVEAGFMTNEKDAALMASDTGRRCIAEAIGAAIVEFDRGCDG